MPGINLKLFWAFCMFFYKKQASIFGHGYNPMLKKYKCSLLIVHLKLHGIGRSSWSSGIDEKASEANYCGKVPVLGKLCTLTNFLNLRPSSTTFKSITLKFIFRFYVTISYLPTISFTQVHTAFHVQITQLIGILF